MSKRMTKQQIQELRFTPEGRSLLQEFCDFWLKMGVPKTIKGKEYLELPPLKKPKK